MSELLNASYNCSVCGHSHNTASKIGREHRRYSQASRELAFDAMYSIVYGTREGAGYYAIKTEVLHGPDTPQACAEVLRSHGLSVERVALGGGQGIKYVVTDPRDKEQTA